MPKTNSDLLETADLAVSQAIQLLAMTEALVYDPPEQVIPESKNIKVTTGNYQCLVGIAKEKLNLAAGCIDELLSNNLRQKDVEKPDLIDNKDKGEKNI